MFRLGLSCTIFSRQRNQFILNPLIFLNKSKSKSFSSTISSYKFEDRIPLQINDQDDNKAIALSHVKSISNKPLLEITIGALFDQQVARYGDQSVLRVIHQDIDWSWNQLQVEVDRMALGLLNLGLKPGDRVGVWLTNCYEWVVSHLATAKAGMILVNVNPAYRAYELEHALNLVGVRALIFAPSFKSSNYLDILHSIIPELKLQCSSHSPNWKSQACPDLDFLINTGPETHPGIHRYDDVLTSDISLTDRFDLQAIADSISPHDAQNIQFTSGTTGRPKGATLTHYNVLNNGEVCGRTLRLTPEDSLCIPVPLYHCFGLVLGNLAAICHGARIVYPAAVFNPLSTLQAVEAENCTALHGVPTMFVNILNHPDFSKFNLSKLRTGIMAGSSCPAEIMRRVISAMYMKDITIAYGMTETSPVSFQTGPDDSLVQRVETVGAVHDHVEAKVVNEQGETVPVGERGHLLTKGYIVMKGYWGNPEKTAESIQDGWMQTGDAATIDEEGYCRIVGRMGDMIIRGGENIYPKEIEDLLYSHPAVLDVQVVGLPDPIYGEEVCAWLILRDNMILTEDEIRNYCKINVSHFKVPRYFMFVSEFPLTVTGKVQKYLMKEISIEKLGL